MMVSLCGSTVSPGLRPTDMDSDRALNEQGVGCAKAAVRIVCAARQQRIPIGDDPANGTCQVGGLVQLAQINRGAASSVIVHRWPDAVGVRLDPANGPVCPAPTSEQRIKGYIYHRWIGLILRLCVQRRCYVGSRNNKIAGCMHATW